MSHDRDGLAFLTAMLNGEIPMAPIAALLEISLTEVDKGRAVFEGEPNERVFNPLGIVHGGYAGALLDSAMGCAIHSTLPAGVGYGTTDLHVRFIRPMTGATGRVRCEGTVVHAGRTTAIAEGRLTDAAGKLIAIGTTACAIFRP
jgi:uncharacterized protein (TIGR00369 family)